MRTQISNFIKFITSSVCCSLFVHSYAHAGTDFETVKSLYTDALVKTAKNLSTQTVAAPSALIQLECFETANHELYMGVKQTMDINASLSDVEAVLNAFDVYHELFPGLKETKVVAREGSKMKIYWEQKVPIPFVPNVKYDMIYDVDRSNANHRIYRYQLHKPGELKFSDGFILIKKINDKLTRYIEYDFFDAEWGPAKIAGKNKLWYDSIEGIVWSDLALKLKAENMKLENKIARKEAGFLIKSEKLDERIQQCIKNKKNADLNQL